VPSFIARVVAISSKGGGEKEWEKRRGRSCIFRHQKGRGRNFFYYRKAVTREKKRKGRGHNLCARSGKRGENKGGKKRATLDRKGKKKKTSSASHDEKKKKTKKKRGGFARKKTNSGGKKRSKKKKRGGGPL